MTHEEALTELKASIEGIGFQCHLETYEAAIEALEKQIPQKPEGRSVRYGIDEEYSVEYSCSNCGCYVGDEYYKKNYCSDCGQAIDWSEE